MVDISDDLEYEWYSRQKENWPGQGNWIVGQFNERYVVLYQAFPENIARPAVLNQNFVTENPEFSQSRMTWVKPNFLWMMFRSNWAQSRNQERILAFKVSLSWFHECLLEAKLSGKDKNCRRNDVVVQWDPDHTPGGGKSRSRRDLQMGLRGQRALQWAQGSMGPAILKIIDITPHVQEANRIRIQSQDFLMPKELLYQFEANNIDLKLF